MQKVMLWAVAAAGLVYGQAPTITSVVDPYTGSTKLAPGGQAVITGTNLGLNPTVTVGGVNAFNLVPPQFGPTITIEIPVNAAVGASIPVIVTTGAGGPSAPFNITLVQYAPVLINLTSGPLTSPRHSNGVAVTASTPAAPGEAITFYAIGLGPTNPVVNTGALGPPSPFAVTTTAPTVTLGTNAPVNATISRLANGQAFFGANYSGPESGSGPAFVGVYLVVTTVPSGTAAGNYPLSISIGGAISNTVTVAVGMAPTGPVITAIVDESGKHSLCPGDVAIISGLNLGQTPAVTVGGKTAFNINQPNGGNQMTIQIPVDAALGASVPVILTTGAGGPSAPFNITLTQFAPVLAPGGNGTPILPSHQNGAAVTAANPAVPGETLFIVAYGLGPTNPVVPTGTVGPSNPPALTVTAPTVNMGGGLAAVINAGLSNGQVGLYYVAFGVPPALTSGNYPTSISIGGLTTGLVALNVSMAPIISNVANAASNITAGLPNAGVAQGAIFIAQGSNLGPGTISIAQNPFQSTNLSGTSISVTVAGVTVAPLMYYTSAAQVAALLPSNTPVGTGTITIAYNGLVGIAAPITVVANNLGIFTVTSDGQGVGIVTFPDYSLVSITPAANCGGVYTTCGAANPGDMLTLWATGLGAVSSDSAVGVPLPNVPLTLWLGGVPATVVYQGRGCCAGEDQINFTVPANVPLGCAVPLFVQIGNAISNYAVMAVAAKGSRTCTPSNSGLSSDNVQFAIGSGAFNVGNIKLQRQPNINGQGQITGNTDYGKAQFFSFTVPPAVQPFILSYVDDLPLGTCIVNNNLNGLNLGNYLASANGLDAGPSIKLTGANGSQNIPTSGVDAGKVTLSAAGNFLSPGAYTVTGTGGADVGSFSEPYTITAPPTLTSPASGPNVNVIRANGLTVTWSGGSANSFIEIGGSNATDNSFTKGASFNCFVPVSAGTFTIPASVLLTLPPGNFGGMFFQPFAPYGNFSASGLNLAFIQMNYETAIFTTYQ